MHDHETSWISGGTRWTVIVDCAEGQTEAECLRQFNEAVTILKTLHPED